MNRPPFPLVLAFMRILPLFLVAGCAAAPSAQEFEELLAAAELGYRHEEYTVAREDFEILLRDYASHIKNHKDPDLADKIRYRIVCCLFAENRLDQADRRLDELLLVFKGDPELSELKGKILFGLEQFESASNWFGKVTNAYRRIRDEKPEYKTAYYRNLYQWCNALFQFDEGKRRLQRFFETYRLRGDAPDWDHGEFRDKLNRLERDLQN